MEGLFVLIAIFNYSFGVIISYLTGWNQSLILRSLAVFTLVFSIYEYISIARKKRLKAKSSKVFKRMLVLYAAILIGMVFTVLVNGYVASMMSTYILSFGTRVLAGIFLGCVVLNKNLVQKVDKWIEPFCIFYTGVLFFIARGNIGGGLFAYGIDRQILSYAGAYSLVLLLYYNFNFDRIDKFYIFGFQITKVVNYAIIVLNIYIVFAGGGRGAFILIVIVYLYYLMNLFANNNRRSFGIGLALLIIGVSAFFVASFTTSVSSGFNHIINTFINMFTDRSSQERIDLWLRAIEIAKDGLFLGGGAGSTAYNLGFYAHNMFIDIIVEYGILGVIASLIIIINVVKKVFRYSVKSITIEFSMIVFLCGFIMLMFSGSWYSEAALWISVTSILGFEEAKTNESNVQ